MHIIEHVAAHYGTTWQAIVSKSRHREVQRARHVCIYIMRHRFKMTYPQIGRFFNRDHSTMIHSARVISEALEREPELASTIDHLNTLHCVRLAPQGLVKSKAKVWPHRERTAPAQTVYIPPPILGRNGILRRNDFDTGAPPLDLAASQRANIRKGSERLLTALGDARHG